MKKGKTLVQVFLAEIGRRGGKAKGGAKAETARENGKLGGRPKKPKRIARRRNNGAQRQNPAEGAS